MGLLLTVFPLCWCLDMTYLLCCGPKMTERTPSLAPRNNHRTLELFFGVHCSVLTEGVLIWRTILRMAPWTCTIWAATVSPLSDFSSSLVASFFNKLGSLSARKSVTKLCGSFCSITSVLYLITSAPRYPRPLCCLTGFLSSEKLKAWHLSSVKGCKAGGFSGPQTPHHSPYKDTAGERKEHLWRTVKHLQLFSSWDYFHSFWNFPLISFRGFSNFSNVSHQIAKTSFLFSINKAFLLLLTFQSMKSRS